MKKYLQISNLLIIFAALYIHLSSISYAKELESLQYGDPDIDNLKKKQDIESTALYNINDDYKNEKWTISQNSISTDHGLLNFDLIFKNINLKGSDTTDLRIELENSSLASMYRGEKVDVNGLFYKGNCQGEHEVKTACTYGGVTLSENNKLENPHNIGVNVIKNGISIDAFNISTDKVNITSQELDVKVRKRINNKFKIYDRNISGGIQKGYIKFHSHSSNSKSFYYDIYDIKGKLPFEYLQIYKDNKIINSKDYHIDVYLYDK
ncbi:exotoxin [Staphylococcus hyicus]|uniref:Exotoxin n=1 Tax=Staphylococcus agnetis TaxID=985762 RepID=A0A2T4MCR2_9STAP|nr:MULTISPECIES: exotoxin beta-grasp domain-containing protein [Staphylococcus]MCE5154942.1 exotoxin [Staphylococcus hyicus]NJI01815.1 exotoxin [Staphylococcus agnetis]PTH26411.1 exotoxin [Staphylococcus agnetis]PTH38011.1 exotoxin [Staphylococcus agnetis]